MKISIFTHMTNPEERMDPWQEALDCYNYYANEVITVGENWPFEFKFDYIGKVFQEGFDACSGDWVINMPTDMFLHEKDKEKLLFELEMNNDKPAVVFPKFKFYTPKKCEFKTFDTLAINKNKFSEVKFNGGGDLCLPTLNGVVLDQYNVPIVNIPIWNYDSSFRTKEIISQDRARFARAWFREFDRWDDRGGETEEEAYKAWLLQVNNRLSKHLIKTNIKSHPMFIQEKLSTLDNNQFGYDCFGLASSVKPKFIDYINFYKLKLRYRNISL